MRDRDRVAYAAHALKGAADVLGAVEIVALCRRMEGEARAGEFAVVRSLIRELEREAELTDIALLQLIGDS